MNRFESVTKPVIWFMALLLAALTAGCGGGGGGRDAILGVTPTVGIAPTVTAVAPLVNATGVPINTKIITAAFSKAMDPATLTTASFTLACPAATPVTGGAVTYLAAGNVATLTLPAANLPVSTICTATITTAAKDTTGIALAANYTWNFTTGATADTAKPRVTLTVPVNLAAAAPANTAITATFNEAMAPATITATSFTLTGPGGVAVTGAAIPVTYSVVSKTATFTPAAALVVGATYTATIKGTGAGAATDLANNALAGSASTTVAADYVWTFTTAAADVTPPTVTLVNPAQGATLVCKNKTINATFSEAMNSGSISTLTFTLAPTATPGTPVTGVVAYDTLTDIASFNPVADLTASTNYTATIKGGASGVKDVAGNALAVDKVWTFDTGTTLCLAPINLRTASTFGTFGGTAGMTNQGILTVINGDIGTIATTTSTVTGFHDTEGDIFTETTLNVGDVNGTIYTCTNSITGPNSTGVNAAYCALATQARLDAETAYNYLATLPSDGVLAGNLAGTTINPGVYTNSSSVLIQGGDLTLDALGDANAVFVFQIGSTLTVGGPGAAFPRSIILAGGAQAKNVFWQVGTFATINAGGGGTMVGTIISQAGVSFSTAGNVTLVTLNGRALSLGASVTMVNTVINVPAP